jgi:amidase
MHHDPKDPKAGARGPLRRRDFLCVSAVGGVAALTGIAAPGCDPAGAVRAVQSPPLSPPFELEEATLAELQEAMQRGKYTARSLCERYLARIDAIDRRGPTLRSVIETNPEALAIAQELDAERKAKGPRGPLHGVPILIKGNIATSDQMATTAGSLALLGARSKEDATVARRLRDAGAVILGKTNLSEWANFRSSKSSSGWSGQGGQCLNPYALDRSPCGSSSGTGAAIAANLAAVGIGTETDGSIVCPSSVNALVGIKPTIGLVSRRGIVPIAHSQDTAGPMTRTVRDAAVLLGALVGPDPKDPSTAGAKANTDYTQFLDANGLKGARLGVVRAKVSGSSPPVDRLINEAISAMKKLGAVIVDPADIPHFSEYDEAELTVLLYEFKAGLNAYLAEFAQGAPVKTLADVIAWNERNKDREMPFFGQDLLLKAEAKGPLTDKEYLDALAKSQRLAREEGLDAVLESQRLDALIAPTVSPAWNIDLVNGDHYIFGTSTPAAVAGYASIAVPVGYVFGLPVGMSFIGRKFGEPTLLKLAYAYEQATRHRRPPQFLPTAALAKG